MGIYYCQECDHYFDNDVEVACVHPFDNTMLICQDCCDKMAEMASGFYQLTDFEAYVITTALHHQIKHDERRINYIENKFKEDTTQDLTVPKKRVVTASELIKRIECGEVYCIANNRRRTIS